MEILGETRLGSTNPTPASMFQVYNESEFSTRKSLASNFVSSPSVCRAKLWHPVAFKPFLRAFHDIISVKHLLITNVLLPSFSKALEREETQIRLFCLLRASCLDRNPTVFSLHSRSLFPLPAKKRLLLLRTCKANSL